MFIFASDLNTDFHVSGQGDQQIAIQMNTQTDTCKTGEKTNPSWWEGDCGHRAVIKDISKVELLKLSSAGHHFSH